MIEVSKWGEPNGKMFKPRAIQDYIRNMRAVDVGDQMMSYHCFVRRSLKWYRKLFIHLVNMLLLNSYILFKKYGQEKMSNEIFRESIVEGLLQDGVQNCNWTLPPSVSNKKEYCSRITERHFPGYIPCALGAKRLRPSRPCYVCTNLPQIHGCEDM